MEIVIGFIIFFLVGGYATFNKTAKEDEISYKKTVEDTTFNTLRSKKS